MGLTGGNAAFRDKAAGGSLRNFDSTIASRFSVMTATAKKYQTSQHSAL